jgi:ribosomal protein L11 methyltransferase
LPHARVIAVDNDPIATAIAKDNTRLNRVAARVHVVTAAGFAHPLLRRPQSFDLILANILPRPLIALASGMRRALRPGGIALLSGLLNHQAHQVRAHYRAAGFRLLSARRHAGWTVLALQRA